jgi:hypothetical protein
VRFRREIWLLVIEFILPCNCKIAVQLLIYYLQRSLFVLYLHSIEREEYQLLLKMNKNYSVLAQKMDQYVVNVF